ncbi:glycosyltransferase family 2 protein [Campylobacter jejuni]|uniref:Glycosyltransferase family 2 protein n=1 Tax=Campylobacter jejuni TaxID=197 RepID=A0A5Y8UCR5_CAMJU|nr:MULTISPECIES: glycosyltransferase family 2 protein [Campylobacter]EAJ8384318.1 glycosyltransferase family 2 protein [Campylobacter jejuni]EAL0466936.1 glycosyltransferase family 2 protein [Campylobacter jejuni]ECL2380483.1 glycosyltransferase family 2 protein [Campylobacter coli]ECL2489519.1 glycosyltransferase family 2 protein [Campylobacter coli]ECL2641387.1 glycosyltransferase family 2 protein [Campylobacter coli]
MENFKISIIIPSLNSITYVCECVDSVLNQTLKDIEIICVDAGSTDGTLEVLREYEKNDERLKVIVSDKKSYGYQMNLGIKEAKGEYLGIVESDDYIKENMYENLYNIAIEKKCDIVKGDMLNFWDKEERVYEYRLLNWTEVLYNRILNFKTDKRILTETNIINPSGIYKLDFIKKYNILCNETPGSAFQDTSFWFQLQVLASSIFLVKEAYYYYRQDNINSSCNSLDKIYCICEEYDFIEQFVLKNKFYDILRIVYYLRYRGYRWNLYRIHSSYRLEFLYKFQKDFKRLKTISENSFSLFKKWEIEQLQEIMSNPKKFYNEVARYKKGAIEFMENTPEYKIGKQAIICKSRKDFVELFRLINTNTTKPNGNLKKKYCDYYEGQSYKEHLSYKIGKILLSFKSNYFLILFIPFQILFCYIKFKLKG